MDVDKAVDLGQAVVLAVEVDLVAMGLVAMVDLDLLVGVHADLDAADLGLEVAVAVVQEVSHLVVIIIAVGVIHQFAVALHV